MARIVVVPEPIIVRRSTPAVGAPGRPPHSSEPARRPTHPPAPATPPPPPPPSAQEVLKAARRERRKAEIEARLAAMSPEDRAREEARIARDVKLTAMTPRQREKYIARERREAAEAVAHLRWSANQLPPDKLESWHAWARRQFELKVARDPSVAARYDRQNVMPEAEILAILGSRPGVLAAWRAGTICRFIRVVWNHVDLPPATARDTLDRMVTAREVRDGVDDPPWMIHALVRSRTMYRKPILRDDE